VSGFAETMREFVEIDWQGRPVRLEVERVGAAPESGRPMVVFLHEGLGSVAMWRGFPAAFCEGHGFSGFVFSRYGYGRSTPRPPGEAWSPDFMHRQAFELLPTLFEQAGIARPWLFGHSDGGSIALLHASRFDVAGVVAVAPHLFVEPVSITSIEKAKAAYDSGDLRERLARYHDDPDSAFRGWNDAWLAPAFRAWNIESEIGRIACAVLAVQGEDDEYGTLEQIRAIQRRLPETRLLAIPECGHSPHRDQPGILSREAGRFILAHSPVSEP
jgi:pimeloyl-ACP methyl ester carboxylesterase